MTLYNFLKIIDKKYGGLEVSEYILNNAHLCPPFIQTVAGCAEYIPDFKITSQWAVIGFKKEPHQHKAMEFPCKIYFADTSAEVVGYTDLLEQEGYLPPTVYNISACEKAYSV